jgi:Ni/Fe-hydrogenase subunit HybB-like protein
MTRTIKGVVIAAVAATTGILLEWFFVVMAGSRIPLNPYDPPVYVPNWVEWSATAGAIAIFTLVIVISLKLLPAVSIWEMEAAEEPPSEESAIGVQP